jgi:hypothetical protein
MCEFGFVRRLIYPLVRAPPLYLLNKRRGGTHSRLDNFGEKKNILVLLDFEPRTLQPLA